VASIAGVCMIRIRADSGSPVPKMCRGPNGWQPMEAGSSLPKLFMRSTNSLVAHGCTSAASRSAAMLSMYAGWGDASQIPEKSGLPSAVRGAGAVRFGLPSAVRGMPGVRSFSHCA
jgi:hypothetical protein